MTPPLIIAWLAARSIARGLPAPVADHDGWRVDTNMAGETRRWVFPKMEAGLRELARTIQNPREFIKLCGTGGELLAALPDQWRLHSSGFFMACSVPGKAPVLPKGYALKVTRSGAILHAQILFESGEAAAGGYASETADAFIYDRIVTVPEHQRKGLGKAIMLALGKEKRDTRTPELLVATEEGRALYTSMGWRVLSPFATASIPERQ